MLRIIPLCFSLLLAGCSTKHFDDSEHEYFSKYIGKKVELLEEQRLCLVRNDINSRAFRTVTLIDNDEYCEIRVLKNLPVGARVTIQRVVKQWMPVSGSAWYALGEVEVEGEKVEFEYHYGYLNINRAPWESEDVPPKRPIP